MTAKKAIGKGSRQRQQRAAAGSRGSEQEWEPWNGRGARQMSSAAVLMMASRRCVGLDWPGVWRIAEKGWPGFRPCGADVASPSAPAETDDDGILELLLVVWVG
jgi:hypothetical protein